MLYYIYLRTILPDTFRRTHTGGIHTMTNRLSGRRNSLLQCWPAVLFLLSFAVSVLTTYYVTKNIIDSDASSELVLSHYLAHAKEFILTKDWLYSTEVRVLNTQLIYSTLFHFFSDWSFVRFCSAIIMQVILLISCGYLLKEAGFGKKEFFLSSSLLLLPISVTYGRIVLYHCYYIIYLSHSFFLIGLTLGFVKNVNWKSWQPYVRLGILAVFSFIGGLGGVRQLMITHAPLLLCIVALCFLEDAKETDASKSSFLSPTNLPLVVTALTGALCSFIGLKINTGVLALHYSFEHQSDFPIGLLPASEFANVAYGYFHHFGFRQGHAMLSLIGILSICGIFAGGFSIYLSIRRFLAHAKNRDIRKNLVRLFSLSITFVTLVLFVISGQNGAYHYVLYLVFCLPWSILLLATELAELSEKTSILRAEKLLPIVAVAVLLANGLVNILFFNGNEKFHQTYEGLHFKNMHIKDDLANAASFLTENGYDIGFATYWNSNILTEATDGRIRMINVLILPQMNRIIYDNWLTIFSYRESVAEKPFMLIATSEFANFEKTELYNNCQLVYQDNYYYVFDILDQALNGELLNTELSKLVAAS